MNLVRLERDPGNVPGEGGGPHEKVEWTGTT